MPTHIKLYGDKSERFERLKAELTEQLGYEPSNPEVIGLLMASTDMDNILTAAIETSGEPDQSEQSRTRDPPEH